MDEEFYLGEMELCVGDWMPCGTGTCAWNNGLLYSGSWQAGVPHGFGRVYTIDANAYTAHYEGAIAFGRANGHGVIVWESGAEYHGCWVNGAMQIDGEGQFLMPGFQGWWIGNRDNTRGKHTLFL